jgi:TRAP-type C4-dicarboxylate transport system permease small subunit
MTRILERTAAILLLGSMALCFVKITSRFLFDYSVGGSDSWSDEISTYCLIASTMMGFISATLDRTLYNMDILYKKATGITLTIIDAVIWLVSMAVVLAMATSAWIDMRLMLVIQSASSSSQMPFYLTHGLLFIGFSGAALALLYNFKRYFK